MSMRKLTLWNDPIGHIKFFFQIHFVSLKICGDWFGVKVYANGTVEFVNDDLYEYVISFAEPMKEGAE